MKSKLVQMKRISLLVLFLVVVSRSLLAQETIRWNKDSAKMVLIPAGSFEMGSNDGELNEKPIQGKRIASQVDSMHVAHSSRGLGYSK